MSGVVAAGTRAGVAGAAGALAVAPPALGSATTASQRASADVSQRLNRRLMLRRVFMQLQSKPGDKGEQVSRAQFRDALASNAAVMAFLGDGKLLQQVAVRSGWLLWPSGTSTALERCPLCPLPTPRAAPHTVIQ